MDTPGEVVCSPPAPRLNHRDGAVPCVFTQHTREQQANSSCFPCAACVSRRLGTDDHGEKQPPSEGMGLALFQLFSPDSFSVQQQLEAELFCTAGNSVILLLTEGHTFARKYMRAAGRMLSTQP